MAINKNHEFEELDNIKCAIVEKNITPYRVEFLKTLLTNNGYTVVVVPAAPSKVTIPAATTETAETPTNAEVPELFTLGVTDVSFNAVNAIFGRILKSPTGHVVTLAYWQQKESSSHDEIPYYDFSKQTLA